VRTGFSWEQIYSTAPLLKVERDGCIYFETGNTSVDEDAISHAVEVARNKAVVVETGSASAVDRLLFKDPEWRGDPRQQAS
jgi:hypothetical protein